MNQSNVKKEHNERMDMLFDRSISLAQNMMEKAIAGSTTVDEADEEMYVLRHMAINILANSIFNANRAGMPVQTLLDMTYGDLQFQLQPMLKGEVTPKKIRIGESPIN